MSMEPVSDHETATADCVAKPNNDNGNDNDSSLKVTLGADADQQQLLQHEHPNFGRSCNFPNKLYDLLEYATTHEDICGNLITWSRDGLSFDIWNSQNFMLTLGAKFFPQQASFRALERQLNNWGFIRTKLARRALRFYHPLFQRDNPQLKRHIYRSILHKPTSTGTGTATTTGTSTATLTLTSTNTNANHTQDPSSPQAPLSGMGHGRRLHFTSTAMFQIVHAGKMHAFNNDEDCYDNDNDDDDSCNLLNCHFTTLQESLGFFKYHKQNKYRKERD